MNEHHEKDEEKLVELISDIIEKDRERLVKIVKKTIDEELIIPPSKHHLRKWVEPFRASFPLPKTISRESISIIISCTEK